MAVSVTLPALGESVTEGTVTRWLKQEGDQVEADEPLLEVSTDKVDTEIPSPAAGMLLEDHRRRGRDRRGRCRARRDRRRAATAAGPTAASSQDARSRGSRTPSRQPAPGAEQAAEQQRAGRAGSSSSRPRRSEQPAEQQQAPASAAAATAVAVAVGGDGGTPVTLPALGESVTEGTVTRWLKQEGDQVEADEPLLEVSTDKVDTEIPSPVAGMLLRRSRSARTRPSRSAPSSP